MGLEFKAIKTYTTVNQFRFMSVSSSSIINVCGGNMQVIFWQVLV